MTLIIIRDLIGVFGTADVQGFSEGLASNPDCAYVVQLLYSERNTKSPYIIIMATAISTETAFKARSLVRPPSFVLLSTADISSLPGKRLCDTLN